MPNEKLRKGAVKFVKVYTLHPLYVHLQVCLPFFAVYASENLLPSYIKPLFPLLVTISMILEFRNFCV